MDIAVHAGLLVGMHGTSRFSYGTVFYPFSFFVLIILFWNKHPEIISLSMLGLAIGDAAAAIVGESSKSANVYFLTSDKKSLEGSMTMFVTTMISIVCGTFFFDLQNIYSVGYLLTVATVAATIATAWEALSSKGLDNFTIPLSIAFILYYYLVPSRLQNVSQYTIGISLSIFIAVASYYLRFLTASGAVATFLLASHIFGLGGLKWAVPILNFFVLSSILSKTGKRQKERIENLFEKNSIRDWGQVAANGGIAGLCMLCQYIWPDIDFYPAYIGAVTAVTADTWGTEIGVWFHGKTISISSLRLVEPGTNGGISLAGFVGGAVGSLIISMSIIPWINTNQIILITMLAGISGSFIDSLLGGTIQATYKCTICNKHTERKNHCGILSKHIQGIQWINNDFVNWICALTGAVVAGILN